ncbi:MAG: hypothetical protein M1503_08495 [Thaumarchaeota archaeon]|nr:hypothetical protein [Nitrososphaerota archaeon]
MKLKNIGDKTLEQLDVRLHSADTAHILVHGMGQYITYLKPNEETILSFQVFAGTVSEGTTEVYTTMTGLRDESYFYWESPWLSTKVAGEVAEIESLFVLSHPYTSIGKTIEVKATIKGLGKSEGLELQFWADTPSGKYEELAKIKTKKLSDGEEAAYSTQITPKETGYYKIYASLYYGYRRIGRKTETIWVQKK